MSDEVLFQHLMDHLFSFYYGKIGLCLDCKQCGPFVAKGALTQSLFEMIAKAIFVLRKGLSKELEWVKTQVMSSPEKYVRCLMMICLSEEFSTSNFFQKLINVCSVVTELGIDAYKSYKRKFYKLTPRILTVFFENNLKGTFNKCGGWKQLEKYLSGQDYLQFSGEWTTYLDDECGGKFPKKVREGLSEFFRIRKQWSNPPKLYKPPRKQDPNLWNNLTIQVVSTLDASLLAELEVSSTDEKGSTSTLDEKSKSLSELGAVGGRSREHSVTSERDEASEGTDDIEATLSDIKNMFKELLSETASPSSDETAKRLASNLGPFFERLKSNLERVVSILNLMENSKTGSVGPG
ncbi:uncharacterized protein NPIL_464241 [Nephila pilipes]|uniref:Uncharacterized protein n=1 Tax=Nephila pilipes TaxID=299642 RepID=A0A8X6N094_NEPPI|nr:uncharacterized protein NPIL_464241 [Nephila pilipes]